MRKLKILAIVCFCLAVFLLGYIIIRYPSIIPFFKLGEWEKEGTDKSAPDLEEGIPPPPKDSKTESTYEPSGTIEIATGVFNLCSAKIGLESKFIETSELCTITTPYYVILSENGTHVKTSFYYGTEFNETYNMSHPTSIFRVFIKVSDLEGYIQSLELYGPLSDYFSLGENIPSLTEGDWLTTLLYLNPNIPIGNEWSYLKFYLRTTEKIYYIGDVWFFVRAL